MKDTSKKAWKCGEGAKQSCKCHGILYYGATKRADDPKKDIKTFEDLQEFTTREKRSDEWMSCTDAEFGGDPWPDQEKQCWCESTPEYKPWRCGDEGEECVCEGGYIAFTAKYDADKKPLDFFGGVKMSVAVVAAKNRKSIPCSESSFDGADPAPDAEKTCFCDAKKQMFDASFVKATRNFWKNQQLKQQQDEELKRTAEHISEIKKVEKEKETAGKETISALDVEDEKATKEVGSAKQCAIQSIEEAYKFKKIKNTQKRVVEAATITKKRGLITTWNFQLNVKKAAAD